ncbi:MAG: DegT/DnrJ/EryC1/StrS family aminotransferase, partial [Armatimonadetes bacterium]|nr:DegT/DnrJ/EryC1/StrS family aminotransferase [Armatimonadota bacterium]
MLDRLAAEGGTPVRSAPFPSRPKFSLADAQQLLEALNQDTLFFPGGSKVYDFQRHFASLYGVSYAVASTSGTSAIHVAL